MQNSFSKTSGSYLVSVIVTAFNQANTIRHALDCILSQNCNFKFEIIIGDDCSTDHTIDICKEYQSHFPEIISLILHQENMGVAANFALCIKEAKGTYIAICAADDFWHNPNKLQLQVDYMEAHPDYGFLYTDYDKLNVINNKRSPSYIENSNIKTYEGPNLISSFFYGQVPALTLTVLFKKELFDKYVPAKDYIKFRFPTEDWITWSILSKYTKVGYLPISTATYCYGHESLSNILDYEKEENRLIKEQYMYQYLCNMFPSDLSYDENSYQIYSKEILLNLAYKKSDYKIAKKYALQIKDLGSNSFKVKMTKNWYLFKIFVFAKRVRHSLKINK